VTRSTSRAGPAEHIRQAAFRRIMTEIADVRPRRKTGLARC